MRNARITLALQRNAEKFVFEISQFFKTLTSCISFNTFFARAIKFAGGGGNCLFVDKNSLSKLFKFKISKNYLKLKQDNQINLINKSDNNRIDRVMTEISENGTYHATSNVPCNQEMAMEAPCFSEIDLEEYISFTTKKSKSVSIIRVYGTNRRKISYMTEIPLVASDVLTNNLQTGRFRCGYYSIPK